MTADSLCMGCMAERGPTLHCIHCGWQEGTPAESPLQLSPRTVLEGKYLIGRALGQGGFGITYLAWDLNLEFKLAIKEYFPRDICTRARDEHTVQPLTRTDQDTFREALDSFRKEGTALGRFRDHPGIVSVLNFFPENGTGYLVMAYMEGVTFKQYLANHGEQISFDEALRILVPAMDALRDVHAAGMLHRDISPDNIYVTLTSQVKLLDFGNARSLLGERSRSFSAVLKPGYAPEEQFRQQGRQGTWTDVYALGATFYRALTGRTPPEAPERLINDELIPPRKLGVAIPPRAERALLKALAVRQQDRFQSMAEFQRELTDFRESPPPPPPPRPWLDAKMKRVALAALVIIVLALVASWVIARRAKAGTLSIGTNEGGAEILIDGMTQPGWLAPRTFPNLKPGPHNVTAMKDGFQAVTRSVDVKPGEVVSLELDLTASPLPQYGELAVLANVAGAEISIDNQTRPGWVTPWTFDHLRPGQHQVTVKKDGYETASQTVAIEAGGSRSLPFDLKPSQGPEEAVKHPQKARKTGALSEDASSVSKSTVLPSVGDLVVTSNVPEAKIVIDGSDTGFVTPHTFTSLDARQHTVSLLKDGYDTGGGSFNVEAGKSVVANIPLAQPTGRFTLQVLEVSDSNPEGSFIVADVDIDGKPYGRSPLSTYLSPGTHHYKVVAGSRSEEGSFEVHAGVGTSEVRVKIPKN